MANTDSQVSVSELKTDVDEGSLAAILNQTEKSVYVGDPNEEAEADAGEPGPGPEETPKEKEPEEPPKHKYASWEEAEAGAREHQSFATRKAEEAKREREAREALEQRLADIERQLAEKAKVPEKTPEEVEAEHEDRIAKALDDLALLNELDPDYRKKAARIWRQAGLGGAARPSLPDPKTLETLIDQRVEERIQHREAASRTKTVRSKAVTLAGDAGLNMKDGSADSILFWAASKNLPEEYDEKPFETQVQWTVNEVRRLKGEVVQTKENMDARGKETQKQQAVMGRGAERSRKPAAKDEPYSLGSILDQQWERRRV